MNVIDNLKGRYPDEWLIKLRRLGDGIEPVDLDNESVVRWPIADNLDRPAEVAVKMLKELASTVWCDLEAEFWKCPICQEQQDQKPIGDLCASQQHSFTDEGHSGPIHVVAIRRAGFERRHVGWLYALHGMLSRGEWQEEFSWNVSMSYGRMVPVRIQKYGFRTLGVTVKCRQRRMVETVVKTLHIAEQKVRQVIGKTKPDVIAHSFGTWLIGHALHSHPKLKIGRLILLGSALRPDFDWATLFRRGQVEGVLNHYGTEDSVIPWAHFGVPDAGPSGHRGFDSPGGWDDELPNAASALVNLPQENFEHSDFFKEEHLEEMFTKYWQPFLRCSELSRFPRRPTHPWPAERWKPSPWPIRAVLGGWKKTW